MSASTTAVRSSRTSTTTIVPSPSPPRPTTVITATTTTTIPVTTRPTTTTIATSARPTGTTFEQTTITSTTVVPSPPVQSGAPAGLSNSNSGPFGGISTTVLIGGGAAVGILLLAAVGLFIFARSGNTRKNKRKAAAKKIAKTYVPERGEPRSTWPKESAPPMVTIKKSTGAPPSLYSRASTASSLSNATTAYNSYSPVPPLPYNGPQVVQLIPRNPTIVPYPTQNAPMQFYPPQQRMVGPPLANGWFPPPHAGSEVGSVYRQRGPQDMDGVPYHRGQPGSDAGSVYRGPPGWDAGRMRGPGSDSGLSRHRGPGSEIGSSRYHPRAADSDTGSLPRSRGPPQSDAGSLNRQPGERGRNQPSSRSNNGWDDSLDRPRYNDPERFDIHEEHTGRDRDDLESLSRRPTDRSWGSRDRGEPYDRVDRHDSIYSRR